MIKKQDRDIWLGGLGAEARWDQVKRDKEIWVSSCSWKSLGGLGAEGRWEKPSRIGRFG